MMQQLTAAAMSRMDTMRIDRGALGNIDSHTVALQLHTALCVDCCCIVDEAWAPPSGWVLSLCTSTAPSFGAPYSRMPILTAPRS